MTPADEIDAMLNDCLLAAGQGIGTQKPVDYAAIAWWHARYKRFFGDALAKGNSWAADRRRVTAVGRYLGQRALFHAGDAPAIDVRAAACASHDIETGCTMNAVREGVIAGGCTNQATPAFSPIRTPTITQA